MASAGKVFFDMLKRYEAWDWPAALLSHTSRRMAALKVTIYEPKPWATKYAPHKRVSLKWPCDFRSRLLAAARCPSQLVFL